MIEDSFHVTTTSTEQSLAAQAKTYFTSRTLTANDGSEASVTSQKISKHQNAIGKKEDPTNVKAVRRPSLVNTQDAIESTDPIQRDTKPAESDVPRLPPTEKPLRERQLLPLPHFGEFIPPPAEFAGYSDTSNRKAEELQDPNEDVEFDEKKASKTTHLSEIFKPSSENVGINDSALNDGNVIVEVHSLEGGSTSVHQQSENEDAEVIGEETQDSHPIRYQNFGHVTGGVHHKKSDQSVNEELLSLLPPWKRQILVNRMVKEKAREKAEREKREIEQRKWIGVPLWKIPLLSKREEDRLKEEQRWIGIPEWKKNLLRRKGTDQLYLDYHAVNTGHPGIRRTVSWKLPEMSADEECDDVTRPRAISSLE